MFIISRMNDYGVQVVEQNEKNPIREKLDRKNQWMNVFLTIKNKAPSATAFSLTSKSIGTEKKYISKFSFW